MPGIQDEVNAAKHDAVEHTLGSFSKNVAKNVVGAMSVSAVDAAEMLVEHGSHATPPPKREHVEKPKNPYDQNQAELNAAKTGAVHDAVESTLGSFSKNVAKNVMAATLASPVDAAELLLEKGSHATPPPKREHVEKPKNPYDQNQAELNAAKTGAVHDAVESTLGSFSKNVAKNVMAATLASPVDAAELLVKKGSHATPPPN